MNNEIKVNLNEVNKIINFCDEANKFTSDTDAKNGNAIVDAKSIMGVIAIDSSTPLEVKIHSDNEDEIKRFNEKMEVFK